FFFFFQAEDGIRDFHVTGVQTCALRIFHGEVVVGGESLALQDETRGFREGERIAKISVWTLLALGVVEIGFSLVSGSISLLADRSEERRVGQGSRMPCARA